MAKSGLGRGLGKLIESASKSGTLQIHEPGESAAPASLDHGFKTILGNPPGSGKKENSSATANIELPAEAGPHPLLTRFPTRFFARVLSGIDIVLLTTALLASLGHPGRLQWPQAVVCSILVILGAGCSILAAFLSHSIEPQNERPNAPRPTEPTRKAESKLESRPG